MGHRNCRISFRLANMSPKIKALLATGRISNLPTVWCNCLVAFLILKHLQPKVMYLFQVSNNSTINLTILSVLLVVASSLIYVGGCFLGDAADADFDRQHKPTRPIPTGILSKKSIYISAWAMLIIGAISPYFIGNRLSPEGISFSFMAEPGTTITDLFIPTLLLLFAVITYSFFHKKSLLLGLPLIGLCRFSLIVFASGVSAWTAMSLSANAGLTSFVPFTENPILIYALAVSLYTICFASVARTESSDSPITWRNSLRITMLALPLLVLINKSRLYGADLQVASITALAIYALWLSYAFSFLSKNKGNYVSKCLAGFCLLDACFVAHFGWIWVVICLALFLLALALQKIAPAT